MLVLVAGSTGAAADPSLPLGERAAQDRSSPPNDAFASARTVVGASGSVTGSTVGATAEAGEPSHHPDGTTPPSASIWYRWTAPTTGGFTIDTTGSDSPTILAVYTGERLGELAQVTADAGSDLAPQSRVALDAIAGTTYHLAVDGADGVTGAVLLTVRPDGVTPPPNDDLDDADVLDGVGLAFGSNVGASAQAGEPRHDAPDSEGLSASIWYELTSPADVLYLLSTADSPTPLALSAHVGNSLDDLTPVTPLTEEDVDLTSGVPRVDDLPIDGAIFRQGNRSYLFATSGTRYRLALDGIDGATGDTVLRVLGGVSDCAAATPVYAFADVTVANPFCNDIHFLAAFGITTGIPQPEGLPLFKPGDPLSRQAMVAFLWRIEKQPTLQRCAANGGLSWSPRLAEPLFADVPTDHPFFAPIQCFGLWGITTGTLQPGGAPLFKPTDPLSRQALAAFLWRVTDQPTFDECSARAVGESDRGAPAPLFADVNPTHPFYVPIQCLGLWGVSTGFAQADGSTLFLPASPLSRQAMAAFLFRAVGDPGQLI
ncbi:MAG: S-layer homology domain-containing protein [Acidimicrobiia bacterium]|nr:S-layer homology domain-containing protein [Acidimicrobiia bacterium]